MPRHSKRHVLIHLAAFLTAALGLYTLLGFIVLPWWIERKLPELGEHIAARVSVQDVSANPFLFALTARGLEVAQQDGTPVLQVPEMTLDIGLASLVERALVVQRMEAREPRLSLVRGPEGRLNVVALLQPAQPRAEPASADAQGEQGLPPILLRALAIERARIEYVDRTRAEPRRLVLAPITLSADEITTRADGNGTVHLEARVAESGSLRAEGTLSLQPLAAEGSVRVEHLPLSPVVALAMTKEAVEPPTGNLDVAFRYRFSSRAGETDAALSDLSGAIADFAWRAAGSDAPMVAWSRLSISGGSVDLAKHVVSLQSVDLRQGRVATQVDPQGRIDLTRIADAFAGSEETAAPERASEPWQAHIGSVQAQGIELLYTDAGSGFPLQARVGEAGLRLALDATFGGAAAQARARDLGVSLQEIRVQAPGSEDAVTAAALRIDGGQVDTEARSVSVASVQFEGLTGSAVRDAAGRIGLPGAAAAASDSASAPTRPAGEGEDASGSEGASGSTGEGEAGSAGEGATRPAREVPTSPTPEVASGPTGDAVAGSGRQGGWRIRIERLAGDAHELRYRDETLEPALVASVGKVQAAAGLEIAVGAAAGVTVSGLDASVSGLALESAKREIALPSLALEQGAIDTAAHRVGARSVTLAGGRLNIVRREDGRLEVAGVDLPAHDAKAERPASTTAGANAAAAWSYDIGAVRVDDLALALADRSFERPIDYALTLDAALENVHSGDTKPIGIKASLRADQGGTIRAQGTARQDFSAAAVRLNVDALALTPFDPLLSQFALLKIASGTASGTAQVRYGDPAGGPRLRVEGDLGVADVLVNETGNGEPFVKWKAFDAKGIALALEPNRLEIAELSVVAPEAELIVSEKRTLNLSQILRHREPQGASADAAGRGDGQDAFPIRVARIVLKEGTLQFADLSLVLPFSTRVHALEGVIVGLSSAPDARAELQLQGLIADYGSASASGTVNAFAPTRFMDIDARFDNVLVPPFSPYTATFAGRTIESGRLWLDLVYRINAEKLSGENKIVIQNLALGERVEAPNAADWPLDLALALLKDSKGRISLEIPVSGDVGDPQFDYGKVIRNAIGSTLTRIVSAPFRALASLFGGGRDVEQLRQVMFDPGSDRLRPAEQQKLADVAKALQARPQLRLVIHGPYDPVQDARVLREREVRGAVAQALGRSVAPGETPDPVAFTDPQTQRVLEKLLQERLSAEDLKTFKSIVGPDDPEYYPAIFGELAARVEIPESALRTLATQRAEAVARTLVESGIDRGRVAVSDVRSVGGDEATPSAIAATLDLAAGSAG